MKDIFIIIKYQHESTELIFLSENANEIKGKVLQFRKSIKQAHSKYLIVGEKKWRELANNKKITEDIWDSGMNEDSLMLRTIYSVEKWDGVTFENCEKELGIEELRLISDSQ